MAVDILPASARFYFCAGQALRTQRLLRVLRRLAGVPPTLALAGGHAVQLIEDQSFDPRCHPFNLAWGGRSELILDSQGSMQAWTSGGRMIAKIATPNRLGASHLQALPNPLRSVYIGPSGAGGNGPSVLNVWDIASGKLFSFGEPGTIPREFSVDPVHGRICV